jgi:hypothetical protein
MHQLIIVIMSIVLTAAVAVASLNYLPSWQKSAAIAEKNVAESLTLLEQGYDVATRSQNGVQPAVTADPDGGFAAAMLPVLHFTPYAPTGYRWVYGQRAADGTQWAGLNYFCLTPSADSPGASDGLTRGLTRLKQQFSPDQLFISAACGSSQNWQTVSGAAPTLRLTFFVAYTPGVTR